MINATPGESPGRIEDLELTRETVQDLTESEAEAVEGGMTGACLEVGMREPGVLVSGQVTCGCPAPAPPTHVCINVER